MKLAQLRRVGGFSLLVAGLVFLSGCGAEEKQAKLDELDVVVDGLREDLQRERDKVRESNEEAQLLADKVGDLERELKRKESALASVQRDLDRTKARADAAKEAARNRVPSSREKREAAKKVVTELLGAKVTVAGDETTGAGFLVEDDGKTWIYVSASMLGQNSKLEVTTTDGGKLSDFGVFEVAPDSDVARLEVKDEVELKLATSDAQELKSGSALLAISEAGALIDGRAYGGEAVEVRVDSLISKCPEGMPVFSGESGGLIGILTTSDSGERTLWEDSSRPPLKSMVRLDRKIDWAEVPIGSFLEEGKIIDDSDRMTKLVFAGAALRPGPNGLGMEGIVGGRETAKAVFDANGSVPAVKSFLALGEWLKSDGERASKSDLKKRVESTYSELGRAARADSVVLEEREFSPYNAKKAAQSLEWRGEAVKKLLESMKSAAGE